MLIVKIENKQTLEKVLKNLKGKVIKTKQNEQLKERKNYTPKSVKKRNNKLKSIYRQKFIDFH
jgi:small subunit ribosomal protein S21